MADPHLLNIIQQGVDVWNRWRIDYPENKVDLTNAKLSGANLSGANFFKANLSGADLSNVDLSEANLVYADLFEAKVIGADLTEANLTNASAYNTDLTNAILTRAKIYGTNFDLANLSGAILTGAYLNHANLHEATLVGADLTESHLIYANLTKANFTAANLSRATLQNALLVDTNIEQATLTNCSIFGISVWSLLGKPKDQSRLIITPEDEPEITVDDLQVAQFVYLLLNRENLRNVLDTITSKAVLILGRFTTERKIILNAIAEQLRKYNLLPIIFDFERPTSRDFTETIKVLAGLCLFIIADITKPKSSPLELQATVPDFQIPFVPLIQSDDEPFSMLSDLIGKYDWVLQPVIVYTSVDNLINGFKEAIIDRAWQKHQELQTKKIAIINKQSIEDFLKSKQSPVDQKAPLGTSS